MHSSGWYWYRDAEDVHARDDDARLRAVLGHCPTCIAVLDENGTLVGYNEEFKSLFSTPPAIGAPAAQLFDEGRRAMLAEVVALAGTRQRAGAIISTHATAGDEHELELLVATLPGDGARTIGVVMAAVDRTKRSNEEAERSLAAREIGEANFHQAIDLAQAAMCHDVNNVLASLALDVALLQKRCRPDDSQTWATLREIEQAVKQGAEIVARARSRARVAVVPRGCTDVRACVERAAQIVAPLARSATVSVSLRVLHDARVSVSGTALTQVLTNLMTNAVHGIQDARRQGRMDVSVECPTPRVVALSVRDDGVGIEPSRLVDSFEAFQTTRAARGGTGLGLAIAREIVEGAGGHIDVLSTPGCATEMRVELPVATEDVVT